MAKNLKFYRDDQHKACARGPLSEKGLCNFLETDIQDDESILQALLDDLWAVDNNHVTSREFFGNAHTVTMTSQSITINCEADETSQTYTTKLKHFHEVLLDWEAFI
jgi:hypothetical protein